MAASRLVPSRNLVLASEHMPAQFRPSNQLRLQPSQATNPALHASTNFMPSFLEYQGANQWGDMGLGQRVVKSANRNLVPPTDYLRGRPPYAVPTSNATRVPTSSAQPATVPAITPAAVNGLGQFSHGAPMPGMGALSATNPFVLGGLALGVIGIAALVILRKKKRK